MIKTIYLNPDDDIPKIAARLKREKNSEVVLVFPKRSFLFSDSINLRLLKKQTDLLRKHVYILTMDETGQLYAKEAGFELKFLPNTKRNAAFSDISRGSSGTIVKRAAPAAVPVAKPARRMVRVRKPSPRVAVRENIFSDDLSATVPPTVIPFEETEEHRYRKGYKKFLVGFVALSLIVILGLVLFILPKADIVVYAKTQPIARDVELSAAKELKSPDSNLLSVPATVVSQTLSGDAKFSSTGKKEVGSKSEGKVYIYNLTKKPLNLKAATTTLKVGSKTYVLTKDLIGIKPVKDVNADPATLTQADIVASSGGEDFNLPAGTRMEITNAVFGAQPQVLFAKTATAITGGTSRFLSVVTADDISKAQAALGLQLVDGLRETLKNQNLSLLDGAYKLTFIDFATDKPAGTESPSFEATGHLQLTGLAFNPKDVSDIIRQRLSSTFGDNRQLQDASQDTLNYQVQNFDANTGILRLSIHFESKAIYPVSVDDLLPRILGKSKQEASEVLLSKPEIDRVDITLSPSWQQSIPRFKQKVHLEVK